MCSHVYRAIFEKYFQKGVDISVHCVIMIMSKDAKPKTSKGEHLMKTTKRNLVRRAMYRLADAKAPLDWETVDLIKELGKAYKVDVYDITGLVDGKMTVVGTGIEDDWYLNKGFAQTDSCDIFERV